MSLWIKYVAAVLLSSSLTQMEVKSEEGDIVIIARKMRMVSINYAMFGPYMRRCDVEKSSGDARIDRMVCAVLKDCIHHGYREIGSAKLCIRQRIDTLDARKNLSGSVMQAEPVYTQDRSASDNNKTPQAPEQLKPDLAPEIVVNAPKLPVAGQWRFNLVRSTIPSREIIGPPPQSWSQCIRPEVVETTLQQIVGKDVSYSAQRVCKMVNLDTSGGSINGKARCMSRKGRSHTDITGSYDSNAIAIQRRTRYVMFTPKSEDIEEVELIIGKFIGKCSH